MTNPPGAMPPLPEPTYIYHLNPSTGEDDLFEFASSGAVDEGCKYCKRLYTADQLQAYAAPLIARVAELEVALSKFARIEIDSPTEIVPNGYANPDDWRNDVMEARAALTHTKD